MVKYLLRLGGRRCRPRCLATSADAFRRGLRFDRRSRRSACGTALRTGAPKWGNLWKSRRRDGSAYGGADGVERPERRVRRRRRAANARSRGPGHWLHNRRAARRCVPAYRLPSGAARGYAATIVGGSVSERPKVQHSKCCVVNSHRGFKSRRYRHNRFMRTLVME